jgi:hypothetical protein
VHGPAGRVAKARSTAEGDARHASPVTPAFEVECYSAKSDPAAAPTAVIAVDREQLLLELVRELANLIPS